MTHICPKVKPMFFSGGTLQTEKTYQKSMMLYTSQLMFKDNHGLSRKDICN